MSLFWPPLKQTSVFWGSWESKKKVFGAKHQTTLSKVYVFIVIFYFINIWNVLHIFKSNLGTRHLFALKIKINCKTFFLSTYFLLKLFLVEIISCWNYFLLKLFLVEIISCWNYFLLTLFLVKLIFCQTNHLSNLFYVELISCWTYFLSSLFAKLVTKNG